MRKLASFFVAGLATLLPIAISLWLIIWLFNNIDNILKPLLQPIIGRAVPGLGFIIIITFITVVGMISTNLLGNKIVGWWEHIMIKIPLLGKIYRTVKRITDSLFSGNRSAFKQVAMVEFPRKGIHSLGFITNEDFPYLEQESYCIFIPTTPNPTSGWLVILPREDVNILDISVDMGMEIIISAGMIMGDGNDMCKGNHLMGL